MAPSYHRLARVCTSESNGDIQGTDRDALELSQIGSNISELQIVEKQNRDLARAIDKVRAQ